MDEPIQAGQVMERLCELKRCNLPLDVRPVEVNVSGVGILSVAFGSEPAAIVTRFLNEARSKGHLIDSDGATKIMEAVCYNRPSMNCLVPLQVSPFVLNLDGIGRFVVPFGVEPAAALADFVEQVARADFGGDGSDEANPPGPRIMARGGLIVDASVAEQVMRMVCANVTCFMPLDVAPLSLNVTGMGTLVVPFGAEPAESANAFLEQARGAGHYIDAAGVS